VGITVGSREVPERYRPVTRDKEIIIIIIITIISKFLGHTP